MKEKCWFVERTLEDRPVSQPASQAGVEATPAELEAANSYEADYYLSALFNIETSPGFRALDLLKREIPDEK